MQDEIILLLEDIAANLRANLWQVCEGAKITPAQAYILLFLAKNQPQNLAAIAKALKISAASASESAKILRNKKLLHYTQNSADGRVKQFSITPEGKRLCSKLAVYKFDLAQKLQNMHMSEAAMLLDGLKNLVDD